ncbi:hypothetical protein [Mesorhizobium tianshanense]|uniref:hypothetical protein n=1 Tax=Mesorhizobium tianshanense TaxID=39844 RepID=UPI00119FB82A|nr:hypothetical protein [Mesorhizobium tianshanense]
MRSTVVADADMMRSSCHVGGMICIKPILAAHQMNIANALDMHLWREATARGMAKRFAASRICRDHGSADKIVLLERPSRSLSARFCVTNRR